MYLEFDNPVKREEQYIENLNRELFKYEHFSEWKDSEVGKLKSRLLREQIKEREEVLIRLIKEEPERLRREEKERQQKEKEEEQWRNQCAQWKKKCEEEREESEKELKEEEMKKCIAEVVQMEDIVPRNSQFMSGGMSFVHPKTSIALYGMVEVYIKKMAEDTKERLVWRGVQHLLMNKEEKGERICVYEDESGLKKIDNLLRKYLEKNGFNERTEDVYFQGQETLLEKKYEGMIWFLDSIKQTGIIEKQICYDEYTTCKLKPLQIILFVGKNKVTDIEVRNYLELAEDSEFERRQLEYYMTFSKEKIENEEKRIAKVISKMVKSFRYPTIRVKVIRYYTYLQELLKEAAEKKKQKTFTAIGEKGENNVDYHLKWLGSNYYSVAKDCYADEKQTILLKKEDFIDEVQELDHILVSRCGVFLIETKYLKGKITVKPNGNWVRIDGGEEMGMLSPVAQVDRHHVLVSEILDGLVAEEHIHDIICIAHDNAIIEGEENSPVPVVKADVLARFIKTIAAGSNDCDYDCEEIIRRIEQYKVNQK